MDITKIKDTLIGMMRAANPETLDAIFSAIAVTRLDREKTYAHPILNFVRTAIIWTLYNTDILQPGKIFTPYRVARMMGGLKDARLMANFHADGLIDWIGYLDCMDRSAIWLIEHGHCTTKKEAHAYFDGWTFGQLYDFMVEIEVTIAQELAA